MSSEKLTVRIQNAGTEVVEAAGAGSATLSMAYAAAAWRRRASAASRASRTCTSAPSWRPTPLTFLSSPPRFVSVLAARRRFSRWATSPTTRRAGSRSSSPSLTGLHHRQGHRVRQPVDGPEACPSSELLVYYYGDRNVYPSMSLRPDVERRSAFYPTLVGVDGVRAPIARERGPHPRRAPPRARFRLPRAARSCSNTSARVR